MSLPRATPSPAGPPSSSKSPPSPKPSPRPSNSSLHQPSPKPSHSSLQQTSPRPASSTPAHQDSPSIPPPQSSSPTVQRPTFSPFFTLISDPTTQTTIHPTQTHYFFSDDDSSALLTSACLRALSTPSSSLHISSSQSSSQLRSSQHSIRDANKPKTPRKSSNRKSSQDTAKAPARPERILILDLNESGTEVVRAQSLSQDWQILSTTLSTAPSFDQGPHEQDENEQEDAGTNPALMLTIKGTSSPGMELLDELEKAEGEVGLGIRKSEGVDDDGQGDGERELQALMEQWERKMGVLRSVVGAGGGVETGFVNQLEVDEHEHEHEEIEERGEEVAAEE